MSGKFIVPRFVFLGFGAACECFYEGHCESIPASANTITVVRYLRLVFLIALVMDALAVLLFNFCSF